MNRTANSSTAQAASPAANANKSTLSSKVMGMKFMQRAQEGVMRQQLQKDKDKAVSEAQWSTPVRPSAPNSAINTPATPAGTTTPATHSLQATPVPFQPNTAVLSSIRPSLFAAEEYASATPSLPATALSLVAADGTPISSASSTTTVAPFVAGRRSYGNFNTQIDAIVAEAKEKSREAELGIKNDKREKKYSVSDENMADHYVGLRGKGAERASGGFSRGGDFDGSSQKKKKKQSGSGKRPHGQVHPGSNKKQKKH